MLSSQMVAYMDSTAVLASFATYQETKDAERFAQLLERAYYMNDLVDSLIK